MNENAIVSAIDAFVNIDFETFPSNNNRELKKFLGKIKKI